MSSPTIHRPRRVRAPVRLLGLGTVLALCGLTLAGCGGRRRAEPEAPRMTTRVVAPVEAPAPVRVASPATDGMIGGGGPVIGHTPAAAETPAGVIGDDNVVLPLPPPGSSDASVTGSVDVIGSRTPADEHGFTESAYAALLEPEETEVLRLRARGDTAAPLTAHLTDREKENLRRRAVESQEIAAEEPVRVGE